MPSIAPILDRLLQLEIQHEVDERILARGIEYFKQGRVKCIRMSDRKIEFSVTGTEIYQLTFELSRGELIAECGCPYFQDWGTCKHIVAAVLFAR